MSLSYKVCPKCGQGKYLEGIDDAACSKCGENAHIKIYKDFSMVMDLTK